MQPARLGVATGSSPRIRGKFVEGACDVQDSGIIPANTGKIRLAADFDSVDADHPREYGENRKRLIEPLRKVGSSPRIRGKCFLTRINAHNTGIIPANTGKMLAELGKPDQQD